MEEHSNVKILENYISWIDAIVSLCRNLDQACANLDNGFPCEANSSRLMTCIRVKNGYSNINNSTYPSQSRYQINNNNDYIEIDEDYYNPNQPIFGNTGNNGSGNPEDLEVNEVSDDDSKNINKTKIFDNHEKDFYGLVIKGLKTNEIYNKKTECVYNLESDIMKKLPVGEKMCVIKKTSGSDDIVLIKYTRDFDYLLDKPFEVTPYSDSEYHYKSSVSGVYWDKRSWIASWYRGGRRFYRSFSSKLYGFYRSKYFAIHTRLFNSPLENIYTNTHVNKARVNK